MACSNRRQTVINKITNTGRNKIIIADSQDHPHRMSKRLYKQLKQKGIFKKFYAKDQYINITIHQ